MGDTTMNYRVSDSFCRKLAIYSKTLSEHLWILSENFNFFKIRKNPYMWPLCITDPEYGVMGMKYGVSVNFCSKLTIYGKTIG
jgi:hypothetical protein